MFRAYLFWTPHEWLALTAEYLWEDLKGMKKVVPAQKTLRQIIRGQALYLSVFLILQAHLKGKEKFTDEIKFFFVVYIGSYNGLLVFLSPGDGRFSIAVSSDSRIYRVCRGRC